MRLNDDVPAVPVAVMLGADTGSMYEIQTNHSSRAIAFRQDFISWHLAN